MKTRGKVISFFSPKGGTGKTTLTMLTATALNFMVKNKDVCILDADYVQKNVMRERMADEDAYKNNETFRAICESNKIRHYRIEISAPEDLFDSVEILREQCDYLFVDYPGTLLEQNILKSTMLLDYIFVPLAIDKLEKSSVMAFFTETMPKLCKVNKSLKIRVVFNMYKDSYALQRDNPYELLAKELDDMGIEYFKNRIYNRVELQRERSTLIPTSYKTTADGKPVPDSFYNFFAEFMNYINQ